MSLLKADLHLHYANYLSSVSVGKKGMHYIITLYYNYMGTLTHHTPIKRDSYLFGT